MDIIDHSIEREGIILDVVGVEATNVFNLLNIRLLRPIVIAMDEGVIHIRSVVGEDIELKMKFSHHIVEMYYRFRQRIADRMKENRLNLVVVVGISIRLQLLSAD